ncbi:MAG: EthD family reductase [Gammaproteobacteria bacterium]|nr:EthD family reductase [Gammaproteobacteria bacterium]
MIRISVLYPNEPGSHFDHDYYLNVHFPLALRLLAPYGVTRIEMDRVAEGIDPGQPSPWHCIGLIYCESIAGFRQGYADHGAVISGDVPNYTNVRGSVVISEMAGSQTLESIAALDK